MHDIISMRDFDKATLLEFLGLAENAEKEIRENKIKDAEEKAVDKTLALLFFEPSTRTRLSFEKSAKLLGCKTIGFASEKEASLAKGESLIDTIKTVENYADAIVIRHSKEGAARLASEITEKPIINAGDGANQHPTQAMIDLYTIRKELGKIENISILLIGDLKYSRTIHSLVYALALFKARISLFSPRGLELQEDIMEEAEKMGAEIRIKDKLDLSEEDAVYVTRIQKERFPDISEYEKVKGSYRITLEHLKNAKKELIILHPLPRVDEIDYRVDFTKHAKYFEQVKNGIFVRVAILKKLLSI